jgi:streptomycin 6-kinase
VQIPVRLRETIERVHGAAGRHWLEKLPRLLEECSARWSLTLDAPFGNLSYNLVIPGRTNTGASVVLKAGVPCRELFSEARALALFGGAGAVRLLDEDAARGLLLLERVAPGTPLHESQTNEQATHTAAALMRRLWRTPPAEQTFPSLASWFQVFEHLRYKFEGAATPFPIRLKRRALSAFARLAAVSEGDVVLHGDLHHANILFSQERGWIAIDPKGVIGERGYEVGSFMLNGLPEGASDASLLAIFAQRLSIFTEELRISRERLTLWAFCHAVLSAMWDLEEEAEWMGTIRLAQLLEGLVTSWPD